MKRILVTGSREFREPTIIRAALADAITDLRVPPSDIFLVHGAAHGADRIAATEGRRLGLRIEGHPADWERLGKSAGPVRNREMVRRGADICLAFFVEGAACRGTHHCVDEAKRTGIPVLTYTQRKQPPAPRVVRKGL